MVSQRPVKVPYNEPQQRRSAIPAFAPLVIEIDSDDARNPEIEIYS